MLERALLASLIIAAGVAAWWAYNRLAARALSARTTHDPLLADVPAGSAAIVYFTTPTCVPCKTQQQPALAQLKEALGDSVQIVQIDATAQPADADRWGVFGAPTTFVLDSTHAVRHINRGVTSAEQLLSQLAAAPPARGRRGDSRHRASSGADTGVRFTPPLPAPPARAPAPAATASAAPIPRR